MDNYVEGLRQIKTGESGPSKSFLIIISTFIKTPGQQLRYVTNFHEYTQIYLNLI